MTLWKDCSRSELSWMTCVRQQILQNLRNPNWNACMSMCLSCSLSQLHLTNCRVRRQLTLAISYQSCTYVADKTAGHTAQYAETLWATCSCIAGRLGEEVRQRTKTIWCSFRKDHRCYLASLFQAKIISRPMIKKKDAVNCSFRLAVRVNQYWIWIRQRLPSPRYLTTWTISSIMLRHHCVMQRWMLLRKSALG